MEKGENLVIFASHKKMLPRLEEEVQLNSLASKMAHQLDFDVDEERQEQLKDEVEQRQTKEKMRVCRSGRQSQDGQARAAQQQATLLPTLGTLITDMHPQVRLEALHALRARPRCVRGRPLCLLPSRDVLCANAGLWARGLRGRVLAAGLGDSEQLHRSGVGSGEHRPGQWGPAPVLR